MPSKKNATRVLIIDDHPLLRQGIGKLIEAENDFTVCGEADEARKAVAALAECKPDVVVLDVSLKGASGIEALKNLKTHSPTTKVLIFSMHDEKVYAPRALRAGASGYLMKQESPEKVLTALRKIVRGETYLSDEMANRMLSQLAAGRTGIASPMETLSDRELEVFTLMGQGNSTREISEKLGLSIKTIESHRAHIKEKLNIQTATELLRSAVDWVRNESAAGAEQPV